MRNTCPVCGLLVTFWRTHGIEDGVQAVFVRLQTTSGGTTFRRLGLYIHTGCALPIVGGRKEEQ